MASKLGVDDRCDIRLRVLQSDASVDDDRDGCHNDSHCLCRGSGVSVKCEQLMPRRMILALSLVLAHSASADELYAETAALDAISGFASEICKEPPLAGRESTYELSEKAKADLVQVLKKIVDLGIEGAAEYRGSESEGALQTALARLVKDSSNCRLEVRRHLKNRLIPAAMQPKRVETLDVRVKALPIRPGQISGVTLNLYIDGEYVVEVGNLPAPSTVSVGRLTKGLHTFRFEDIAEYSVNMFGGYHRVTRMSPMACNGDFGVAESKTYQLVVWNDGMGNLACDLK